MTVVGAPFFEELFFRGLLFKALARVCTPLGVGPSARRTAGLVVAVVLDGLLFGLAHGEWEQFAGLAAFGMVLAVISYRTGRLGLNMVTHASFNLVAVIAVVNSRGGAHPLTTSRPVAPGGPVPGARPAGRRRPRPSWRWSASSP